MHRPRRTRALPMSAGLRSGLGGKHLSKSGRIPMPLRRGHARLVRDRTSSTMSDEESTMSTNRQLSTLGLRFARRHPRRALRVGLLGSTLFLRHTKHGRLTARLVLPAKRVATDPKVHAETRRAMADAVRAVRRAQRVGAAKALTDRRVARNARHATRHASRAAHRAVQPPRHRVRNTTIAAVGAGVVAGAAYGGRRTYSMRSQDEVVPAADDTTAAT
jgi:hypothetical protein